MTPTNQEVFYTDPTTTKIPNDGVVQVARPESDQQWAVLEWELRSFVCEGSYETGLERILNSFLTNLEQSQQPAVWVSGFYGSGKSHLLRVLEYLWLDTGLPSGESARGIADLPDDISDHLRELSNAGKRGGGLWSAAGTLASGKSDAVRLAFLSVLFDSAGFPEQYPLARFMIWARENDYYDAVDAAVASAGKTLDKEIHDLYVSPIIAKALLEANPDLATSEAELRQILIKQFPPTTTDITDDDMFDVMDDVLRLQSSDGKLPLTLVVLDEMQQYIGESGDKALAVQHIVEGCAARFGSQVLIVAAGQSALAGTATLQKLTDRFAVQVALSDQDVDAVVRRVVLRKKPEFVDAIATTLDDASGEIDQQLGGTQLAATGADIPDLVPDYPLLPSRRRFWERALRAIDKAGKTGVLRTQLRTVHEAARHVAKEPLGHVVGGDFIYDQQSAAMVQSNVLLREIDDLIRGLKAQGSDGQLKSRICALVFLMSQIPKSGVSGDTGLRATAPLIADLLVEDLENDGSRLRKAVPALLEELVAAGALMQIGDEHQLQTAAGAEWEQNYRQRAAAIRDDSVRVAGLRDELLAGRVRAELGNIKLNQGASTTPRKVLISLDQDEPASSSGEVPVWVRDEWNISEGSVKAAAAEAGDGSPVVYVFIPKHDADQLKEALASATAAQETIDQSPVPQTDDGKAALLAMKTRAASESERVDALAAGLVARARVFQGGGSELTTGGVLAESVRSAVGHALIRLFPKFGVADNPNWGKVVAKAREGAPDALLAVGYSGEPVTNPVCKEIFGAISAGGTKGADLHKQFDAPPYGWPKDAVNGAVLALLAAGNIRAAADNGSPVNGPAELLPAQVGRTTFYKEDDPPTVTQQLAVKGLLTAAFLDGGPGSDSEKLPALLQRLKDLASRAGGAPPLPDRPDTAHIEGYLALGGNQRFRAVADDHERLSGELADWAAADQRREQREAELSELERLLRHAKDLPVADQVEPAIDAIRTGRQLLDEPDPIKPLLTAVADALRAAVKEQAALLGVRRAAAVTELETWGDWQSLPAEARKAILTESQLTPPASPDVSDDTRLLEGLDLLPLSGWVDQIGLVTARREQAKRSAAQVIEPESVNLDLPSATLKTSDELEAYLEGLRELVLAELKQDKTVVI